MAIDPRSRRRRSEGGRSSPRGRAATTSPRREAPRHPTARPSPPRRPGRPAEDLPDDLPDDFPPPTGADRPGAGAGDAWAELLDRVAEAWGRGEPIPIEGHVAGAEPGDAVDLIYHEFCLAEASGRRPDPAGYLARFPAHAEALGRLFGLHDALSVAGLRSLVGPGPGPGSGLPVAGDEVGPYRLLREMGRGSFARVFLAEQADLGDRLVVVKVSTRPSSEPALLGRARHPHIVEVLRHIDDPESGLHLVCLPFLGGATLGALLDARRDRQGSGRARRRRPRSGRDLLADLDRASAPEYPSTDRPRPARAELARLSHPKAVAWVVARLAEALDHAWRRGVTHGDLKPSNVLLTADGVPMLFDFNLASEGEGEGEGGPGADPGGTLAYMAPERLRALAESARREGDPVADPPRRAARSRGSGRHRADIYALGLVLAEALTGDPPATPGRRSDALPEFADELAVLRAGPRYVESIVRPGRVPPALRSILARCLAPDPGDRYAHAGELAEDLDRYRADRPPVFAPEPRRAAWARRLRRARYPLGAVGLVLLVASVAGWVAWSALEGTQRDQALAKWSYILDRTEGVFPTKGQRDDQRKLRIDLADLAKRHLAHYQVVTDPDWRDRPDVRALPGRERGELEAFLLAQVVRLALAYAARPDSPQDWRRALSLVEREIEHSPLAALLQQRAILRERLGPGSEGEPARPGRGAALSDPEPWLDAYLLGVQAEPLHAREALGFYRAALASRPDFFWGHIGIAATARRLGEFRLAVDSMRLCVARRPENPMLRDDLAWLIFSLGQRSPPDAPADLGEALEECQQALALDPDHLPATEMQAVIQQVLGHVEGVRASSDRAHLLVGPADSPGISTLGLNLRQLQKSYQAAQVVSADVDELTLRRLLSPQPRDARLRTLLANQLVRSGQFAEATAIYQGLIDDDPDDLYARYQHAFGVSRTGGDSSLDEFLALTQHPRFEEFVHENNVGYRVFTATALRLLDRGRLGEAEAMVQRGWRAVDANPQYRPEMVAARNVDKTLFPEAELHYRAAQIDVAAARTNPARLADAVDHLRRAFDTSPMFRDVWFASDPYFDRQRESILSQVDRRPRVP